MGKTNDIKWIPYEEHVHQKEWYHKKEQELLEKWRLGWIRKFCSTDKEENKDETCS
jgi:hypothetical protein